MSGISNDHNNDGDVLASPHIDLDAGRRAFFKVSGLAAASATILGANVFASGPVQAQAAPPTDVQILNFALNLEYLEAEFYLHAANGTGLAASDTTGVGMVGTVYGGSKVDFSDRLVADYANEIANDELTHVRFLRSALGNSAVARPYINIGNAFTAAAQAAGIISSGQQFDAYRNDLNFLLAAYIFEDVGVTAYHGAAALISNKDTLTAAAGILAVEAYHAGLVRTVLFAKQMADPSQPIFKDTRQISQLRNNLSRDSASSPMNDQGIGPDASTGNGGTRTLSNIVPTDANGLAFARTPRQVLNIVYGAKDASQGLFFPRGVNAGNAN